MSSSFASFYLACGSVVAQSCAELGEQRFGLLKQLLSGAAVASAAVFARCEQYLGLAGKLAVLLFLINPR